MRTGWAQADCGDNRGKCQKLTYEQALSLLHAAIDKSRTNESDKQRERCSDALIRCELRLGNKLIPLIAREVALRYTSPSQALLERELCCLSCRESGCLRPCGQSLTASKPHLPAPLTVVAEDQQFDLPSAHLKGTSES